MVARGKDKLEEVRAAIEMRGGQALVVSAEGTLEKRAVTLGVTIGDIAVVVATSAAASAVGSRAERTRRGDVM